MKFILSLLSVVGVATANYKSGSVSSYEKFQYGKFVTRMRTPNQKGTVSSFFTYWDGPGFYAGGWNELDIEVVPSMEENPVSLNMVYGDGHVKKEDHDYANYFKPDNEWHTYAMEWTPKYISFAIDGKEVRHVRSKDNEAAMFINKPQSLRMNFWTPTFHSWGKNLDPSTMPWYLMYDYVEVFTYNEDRDEFEFDWRDDFDEFDSNRWHKASGGFEANSSVFYPSNVFTLAGNLVIKMEPSEDHTLDTFNETPALHGLLDASMQGKHDKLHDIMQQKDRDDERRSRHRRGRDPDSFMIKKGESQSELPHGKALDNPLSDKIEREEKSEFRRQKLHLHGQQEDAIPEAEINEESNDKKEENQEEDQEEENPLFESHNLQPKTFAEFRATLHTPTEIIETQPAIVQEEVTVQHSYAAPFEHVVHHSEPVHVREEVVHYTKGPTVVHPDVDVRVDSDAHHALDHHYDHEREVEQIPYHDHRVEKALPHPDSKDFDHTEFYGVKEDPYYLKHYGTPVAQDEPVVHHDTVQYVSEQPAPVFAHEVEHQHYYQHDYPEHYWSAGPSDYHEEAVDEGVIGHLTSIQH